jgi:hypothetical protein
MGIRAVVGALLVGMALAFAGPVGAVETEVLFGGAPVSLWDTSRDASRLQAELSRSDVEQADSPRALHWRFVSRGVSFNDLFLRKRVEQPFSTLRLRVRNDGEPVTLAVKVLDSGGAEWTAQRVPMPRGSGWQWVDLPKEQWHPAPWSSDPDGGLDFPLAHLALIAFDVKPGAEYDLSVERVEAIRPDPPVARLSRLTFPARLRHGQRFPVSLDFTLNRPCEQVEAWLSFRRGGAEAFRAPLPLPVSLAKVAPGRRVAVRAMASVPEFVPGGRFTVALRLGEARVMPATGGRPVVAQVEGRKAGATMASVKLHGGVPTLFINGKPHNGMAYAAYGPSVEVFRDFARAGVSLFTFSATPTESGYGLSRTAWTAPGKYDFSELDQRVMMVLQANPKAYFFPRLYLHAPRWWSAQHPEELVMMDPGDGKPVPFLHAEGKPAPSWGSEVWRRDTIEALRRLIAHVEASPYADRCIGYHLASGSTEEWMMWGANEDQWVDYSPANLQGFRRWLAARYRTDDPLRAAWHDGGVTLAAAAIPTKVQRQSSTMGSLRDPAREQQSIDYYLYNSDLVADTITTFAGAVKGITHRTKIVGVFYGYLLQLCGEQRQQNAGHLALEKVLSSPDVDFVCSPTSYAFRQLGGEGTSHFMSLQGSVRLHGKLWFDENDIRTSLSGGQVGEWGRPANVEGDLIQQDKELANVLTNGAAQWWFDVGGNRYNNPALMARLGELTRAATKVQALDRAPVDEVAMVVDERSLCSLKVGDPMGAWLLVNQLPALHRIGAPVGHYLVTDLPRLKDRKLFLIATSFAPTEADRKAIDALKRDGHVLVFLYAPGLYSDGRADPDAMEQLTGIRLNLSREPAQLRVTGLAPAAGGQPSSYGVDQRVTPVVTADDPSATILGTLADGRPGLVMRRYPNWTAVFSSAPMLSTEALRDLAKMAGVHLYLRDSSDVVWACRSLLAVSALEAGPRTLHLPHPSTVTDLFTGATLARNASGFTADFTSRQTRVFVLGAPGP